MFDRLRNLLGKPNKSAPSAHTSGRDDLIQKLLQSDILIIAAMQSDGIDPKGLTKEQLLEEIRRTLEDTKQRQNFQPFVYEADGKRRLPFFSSQGQAEKFVGWYSKLRNRVFPFQILGVKGSLLPTLLPACDVLVMNDRCDDELVLSGPQMASLQM
jgi:hypothetical protein